MSQAGWSTSLSSRRALLGAGATATLLLALAGCGFQPMYGPAGTDGGLTVDMRRELAAVRLDYIGERSGVLLRRALERRFQDAAGEPVPAKYTLQLNVSYGTEILGYRTDGGISRARFTATSNWALLTRATPALEIGRGTVRTIDAFNVPDFQFFSAEVSSEAMQRRLLDEIVDQVFLNVAARLRGQLRAGQG